MTNTLDRSTLTTAAQMFASAPNIRVQLGAPRTDGDTVWIPGLKENLTSAEMQLVRGYFAHECAHIRYQSFSSSASAGRTKVAKSLTALSRYDVQTLFNVFEDVRIEHYLQLEKLGSRETIKAIRDAARHDNDSNFDGQPCGNMTKLFMNMCHAMIWHMNGEPIPAYCAEGMEAVKHVPGLLTICSQFTSGLAGLGPIVDGTSVPGKPSLFASQAACKAAKVIDKWITDMAAASQPEQSDQPEQPEQAEEDSDNTDIGNPMPTDGNPTPDNEGAAGGAAGTEEGDGEGDGDGDGDGDGGGSFGTGVGSWEMSGASTDVSLSRDAIKTVQSNEQHWLEGQDITIAKTNPARWRGRSRGCPLEGAFRWGYSEMHSDAMRITRSLRPLLGHEDRVSWSQPRESGHRPDPRAMPQFAAGATSRVLNIRSIDKAPKTLVTILLDQSGSMDEIKHEAMRACVTIADACESMQVKCGLIGYDCHTRILKSPGEKVTPTLNSGWRLSGGTCCNEALRAATRMELQHPRHKHVQFFLTDGATGEPGTAMKLLQSDKDAGVIQYGIDLDGGMTTRFRNYFDGMGRLISISFKDVKKGSLVCQLEESLTAIAKEAR